MATNTEYYDFLGVSPTASDQEIKKAYIRCALKYHPDKNPGNEQEAKEKFQRLNQIYTTLKDPETRKEYDLYGEEGLEERRIAGDDQCEEDEEIIDASWSYEDIEQLLRKVMPNVDPEKIAEIFNDLEASKTYEVNPSRMWSAETVLEEIDKAKTAGVLRLDWSRKLIRHLPPEVGQLSKVKTLILADNELAALPEELSQLTQLRELNLSRNKLSTLPDWIGRLTALQTLILEHNLLTTLPSTLKNLTRLTTLVLFANQLKQLPDDVFEGMNSLSKVDLECNFLKKLPRSLVDHLRGRGENMQLSCDPTVAMPADIRRKVEANQVNGPQPPAGASSAPSPLRQALMLAARSRAAQEEEEEDEAVHMEAQEQEAVEEEDEGEKATPPSKRRRTSKGPVPVKKNPKAEKKTNKSSATRRAHK